MTITVMIVAMDDRRSDDRGSDGCRNDANVVMVVAIDGCRSNDRCGEERERISRLLLTLCSTSFVYGYDGHSNERALVQRTNY